MATRFGELIHRLVDERVDFALIGGLAVAFHGHGRLTVDVDICYARTPGNFDALVRALSPLHPRLRGAPPELPFIFDARTLKSGLNFTLVCDAGEIDLLGEVTGIGGYADIAPTAVTARLFDRDVRIISLELLERAKRASGRAKDLLDLEALRAIKTRNGGH